MRIHKALKANRIDLLNKVSLYVVCRVKCGRDYLGCGRGPGNPCADVANISLAFSDVFSNQNNPVRKDVAVLVNGVHEDN